MKDNTKYKKKRNRSANKWNICLPNLTFKAIQQNFINFNTPKNRKNMTMNQKIIDEKVIEIQLIRKKKCVG